MTNPWMWVAGALWCGVAWIALQQYRHALTMSWVGVDVRPLQGAGRAVLAHGDVYAVRNFVYPPSAAVLSVPLTWLAAVVLVRAMVVVQEVVLAGLAVASVLAFVPRRPERVVLAPLLAGGLLAGFVSYHALALANVSVLLAPVVVAVAVLGGRGRWWGACAVLVFSLLVKPLLAPVLLVAFVARRWMPPVACLAVAGVIAGASLPLTGGANRVVDVVLKLLRGSILVGGRAANNLSITGFSTVHRVPDVVLVVARLSVVLLTLVSVAAAALVGRRLDAAQVAWTGSTLLLVVFLAGNLSEVHYLYALVPGAVAVLARARSGVGRGLAFAGLALLCLPLYGLASATEQALSMCAEVVLTLASAVAALAALRAVQLPRGAGRTPKLREAG